MDAQQYVDEEEDLGDGAGENDPQSASFFKRRSTQIAPEGQ